MKRTLLISMVLLMASVVMAGPITREQARQKAAQFLVSQGKPAPRSMSPAKVKASNGTEVTQYYVFNIGQRQGFVIVSGDDRTDAILGWADEGELDTNNMPENLRAWLQGYADQLQWLEEHPDAPAQHAPRRTASATRQPIAPMMTTKWNQGTPYNTYCPTNGSLCVTGCVCTATAQVMYHRAIANGIATTTTSANIPAYNQDWYGQALTGVPSTGVKAVRTFTWSKFSNTYPASDEANEEVARLMEYVGAGLKMDYNTSSNGGSAAYDQAIPDMLETYFGYDDAKCIYRCDYIYEDWINIIYNELQTNGPTMMGGCSTGGGHAFVCDGYSEEDYFHINWGWGGKSDGYFKLSVLYPEQQGIGGSTSQDGYNIDQDLLVNIKPTKDSSPYSPPTPSAGAYGLTATLTNITGSTIRLGKPITIKAVVTNPSTTKTFSGSLSLYSTTNSIGFLAGQQVEIAPGASKTVNFTFTIPTSKPSGSYTLNLCYSYNSSSYYCEDGSINITVNPAEVINHGTLTITNVTINETSAVSPDTWFDRMNYGGKVRATLSIKNTHATYGYHNLPVIIKMRECTWTKANRDGSWSSPDWYATKSITVDLNVGETKDYDIEFEGLSTSTYISYLINAFHYDDGSTKLSFTGSKAGDGYRFYCDPGVTVYNADGTETTTTPATNITGIAADALAVDVSDITGVTKITPGGNPNTLYFINAADNPTGLDGCNVVKNGTCAKLTLTDGYGFWTPKDFTATEATFTRTFTNGVSSGSSNGWYTIILPFAVSQVKQGENVIDWFRSASEEGKNFWLKTFSSEDGSTVNFDFAGSFNANTPYIIAVPGNEWGDKWDLRGKPITFLGTGVTISADAVNATNGFTYKFAGVTKTTDAGSVYQLNAEGNKFVTNSANVAPFCAYFKANGSLLGSLPEVLSIGSEGNEPTAISNITTTRPETDGTWYTLDGRRVENPTKGIYIRNGKKVVIK